ncbi:hypothetical protein D1164_05910 [Mariniphaga sediminis]|uniref:Tetratricopeptide repeat protein n=1 Tax=Mariniphaga sediminis TaxID=1628158 RepID=A0A399D3G7_9BACT|nr:hypothetical protein [Mariniphaga sediminis]RIH66434.1 hypothetical protein D1164_05910 [Mariniphaga sediminis]
MILSGKIQLFFLCLLLLGNAGHAQNLFNTENSKKFAHYLLNTRQYNLAAIEYERILNISPPDAEITSNLIKTYRLGKICEGSFQNIKLLGAENFFSNDTVASEFLNLSLTCNCCYQKSDFEKAIFSLPETKQAFYRLGYYFFNHEEDSLFTFSKNNQNLLSASYPSVFNNIGAMENYKGKSPALAMALSAIVPGSGKAYSGLWGDALMSFIFVSSNAWLSYRGFNKKGTKSASGWIFGGLSAGFYIGNIWGSGKAARTYNQIEYDKLYHEAQNSIYNHF